MIDYLDIVNETNAMKEEAMRWADHLITLNSRKVPTELERSYMELGVLAGMMIANRKSLTS